MRTSVLLTMVRYLRHGSSGESAPSGLSVKSRPMPAGAQRCFDGAPRVAAGRAVHRLDAHQPRLAGGRAAAARRWRKTRRPAPWRRDTAARPWRSGPAGTCGDAAIFWVRMMHEKSRDRWEGIGQSSALRRRPRPFDALGAEGLAVHDRASRTPTCGSPSPPPSRAIARTVGWSESSMRRPIAYAIRFSVNERTSGIGRDSSERVELRRRAHFHAVVHRAARVERRAVLAVAQAAGHVEVVERQADRIHVLVAGVARGVGAVHLHALARGEQLAVLAVLRSAPGRECSAAAAAAACR